MAKQAKDFCQGQTELYNEKVQEVKAPLYMLKSAGEIIQKNAINMGFVDDGTKDSMHMRLAKLRYHCKEKEKL